jgi:hypothetical protein
VILPGGMPTADRVLTAEGPARIVVTLDPWDIGEDETERPVAFAHQRREGALRMVAAPFEGEPAAERREALLGHRPGLVENALPEAEETGLQEAKPAVAGGGG